MEISDIFKLSAGTYVWSIPLQCNVSFEKDIYFIITNTVWSKDYVFAYKIETNMFGPLHYKKNEIMVSNKDLIKTELPKPFSPFLEWEIITK